MSPPQRGLAFANRVHRGAAEEVLGNVVSAVWRGSANGAGFEPHDGVHRVPAALAIGAEQAPTPVARAVRVCDALHGNAAYNTARPRHVAPNVAKGGGGAWTEVDDVVDNVEAEAIEHLLFT
tara:strand:- start:24 stop:389 length:366 start_codon:yes stop_codon:yes gene_type:complete